MPTVELERTLVKSPPELWEEIASEHALSRWLGAVRVSAADPPHRLEWDCDIARGVIELEAAGWGTRVRAVAETSSIDGQGDASADGQVSRQLEELLDDLGSSSLTSGG